MNTTFEYNALFDDVYSSNCFIYHDVNMNNIPPPPDVDVENNYWGTSFNPSVNLCPDDDHYDYGRDHDGGDHVHPHG